MILAYHLNDQHCLRFDQIEPAIFEKRRRMNESISRISFREEKMLFNKVLNWLLQNWGKAILTTVVLFGSGYLTVFSETRNDLREGLSAAIDPYPEYHVYMDSCSVQPRDFNQRDTLSIRLLLCNATANPLQNVRVKIDSGTIKICGVDSVKFFVARERNGSGKLVRMDSLSYLNVSGKTCRLPYAGSARLTFFKFCADLAPATADTICVKFTAKIYESDKPAVKRGMEFRMPNKPLSISSVAD
jgi:hypothetical protein